MGQRKKVITARDFIREAGGIDAEGHAAIDANVIRNLSNDYYAVLIAIKQTAGLTSIYSESEAAQWVEAGIKDPTIVRRISWQKRRALVSDWLAVREFGTLTTKATTFADRDTVTGRKRLEAVRSVYGQTGRFSPYFTHVFVPLQVYEQKPKVQLYSDGSIEFQGEKITRRVFPVSMQAAVVEPNDRKRQKILEREFKRSGLSDFLDSAIKNNESFLAAPNSLSNEIYKPHRITNELADLVDEVDDMINRYKIVDEWMTGITVFMPTSRAQLETYVARMEKERRAGRMKWMEKRDGRPVPRVLRELNKAQLDQEVSEGRAKRASSRERQASKRKLKKGR